MFFTFALVLAVLVTFGVYLAFFVSICFIQYLYKLIGPLEISVIIQYLQLFSQYNYLQQPGVIRLAPLWIVSFTSFEFA